MITFSGNITVSGTVTFLGDSVNAGTINGNAVFKGTSKNGTDSENGTDGTVTGTATFNDNSLNTRSGQVNGSATFNKCAFNGGDVGGSTTTNRASGCPPNPYYQDFNPPRICHFVTSGSSRRLICTGSSQVPGTATIYGGDWQPCPSGGCFTDTASYRPFATVHYVLEAYNSNYESDGYCLPANYTVPDGSNSNGFFNCDRIVYNPPMLAMWILIGPQGGPWLQRKLGIYQEYGRQIIQTTPVQDCPSPNNGCYENPESYRPLVNFDYTFDLEHFPEYLNYDGYA